MPELKALLEETIRRCSHLARRDNDPIGLVHPYPEDSDREVAALFASCLAYGRVELLREAIHHALAPLGSRPARYLRSSTIDEIEALWPQFSYRMTRGADLRDLACALQKTLKREGSLQALYAQPTDCGDVIRSRDEHLELASTFVRTLRRRRHRSDEARGFRYLLPDPADGSACKRLHLFFRWVVRGPDAIDLGLWDKVDPAALIMPLDTHTSRLCRYLGMLERKTVDGKAAQQVTRKLAALEASDPLRYDFALCHLGISGRCIHRYCSTRCPKCPIEPACILIDGER